MNQAWLKTLFKLSLVALLFYFLGRKGLISLEATGRAFTRLDLILPGFALALMAALLSAARWQILMRAQDFRLPTGRTLRLSLIGAFFNLALPGAVSGDFVKAFYVAKETDGRRGHVFGTILFDRVAGVSALVLVSAGALLSHYDEFRGTPLLKGISVLVKLAALAVVSFYAYLFLVREHHDPVLVSLRAIERRWPRVGALARIYEGLRHYHHRRGAVLAALGISIVIHLSACGAALLYLRALGVDSAGVAALPVFVVVPLGLLVTAVPVTPAGVGTGHAAFGWLFGLLGTPRGADVFSLVLLAQFLIGAVGGLIYLRFRAGAPAGDLERALAAGEGQA
jgi:uncharacterized protein (TIRG00374 family)